MAIAQGTRFYPCNLQHIYSLSLLLSMIAFPGIPFLARLAAKSSAVRITPI